MEIDFDQDPFWALDPDNPKHLKVILALQRELQKEVAPGHILYGKQCRVIAKREDTDDIIVELENGQIAYVHLTWCSGADTPPWPSTGIYSDKPSFWKNVMLEEIRDYNERMAD